MPRFYLNLWIDEQMIEDEEGFDLPSVDAARQEAIKGVRSILADDISCGKLDLSQHIEVTDETGAVVAHVLSEEAVAVIPQAPSA